MMLLAMIPAMMTALGVVREREIGSIANLYASPATVGEFLIGKQLPYLALGFVSFLLLVVLVGRAFRRAGAGLARGAARGRGALHRRHHRLRPVRVELREEPDRGDAW